MKKKYIALFFSLIVVSAIADTRPDIFVPPSASTSSATRTGQGATTAPAGKVAHRLSFNSAALNNLPIGGEARLSLPNHTTYIVVHDRKATDAQGNVTWIGYLKGYGNDYRVIVTRDQDGSIAGQIATPEGQFMIEGRNGTEWVIDKKASGLVDLPFGDDVMTPPTAPKQ